MVDFGDATQIMLDWEFPGSTCEAVEPTAFVKQPYSTAVNLVAVGRCVHRGFQAKTAPRSTLAVLVSLSLFELAHACSHAFDFAGGDVLQHAASHASILSVGWALSEKVGVPESTWWRVGAASFFVGDALCTCWFGLNLFSVFIIAGLLMTLIAGFLPYLDTPSLERIYGTLACLVFIVFFEVSETLWCAQLLEIAPFPPHLAIEISGVFFFDSLAMLVIHAKPRQDREDGTVSAKHH